MQIIDKVAGAVPFGALSEGQVFRVEFGGLYLKISSSELRDSSGLRYNAFDLEDHYLAFIKDDVQVMQVEATLTITSLKEK